MEVASKLWAGGARANLFRYHVPVEQVPCNLMFIFRTSEYLPEKIVDNEYFSSLLGKPTNWFFERTGIRQRRRAAPHENVHTMAFDAVRALVRDGGSLAGVDLVVGASYTPLDTIGTLAHAIQREFALAGARALYLSTACSSFLDGLEIASLYLKAGKARKALIVAAEHNSAYARDEDISSGHLWGDGAAAVLVGVDSAHAEFEILDVETRGLGELGHGPEAVMLRQPVGITMPHGREVFMHACENMARAVRSLLSRNGLNLLDVALFVPHQANGRILTHVAHDLKVPLERFAMTIEDLGNTGCASVAISLHRHGGHVGPGQHVALVTFGGGYSVGAALLRRVAGATSVGV